MNWISSQFNYCFQYDSVYLVYNTLNTKIYQVDKPIFDVLRSTAQLDESDFDNDHSLKILRQDGVFVRTSTDEKKLALSAIYRIIYDNKLNITIIPTFNCNFRCNYCFEDHTNHSMSDETEAKIIRFFERNIRDYRSIKITWFGGEPLIEVSRILRMMERINLICKKNNVPIIAEMITNGYFLDKPTLDALISQKILFYEVTLDGWEHEHDELRPLANGDGTFSQILRNLIDIQVNTRKRFKIVIRTNLCKSNAANYRSFVKKMKNLLHEDRRFEFLAGKITDWGGSSIETLQDDLLDELQTLEYTGLEAGQEQRYSIATQDLSQLRCDAGKYYGFVISPDASLYKCGKISSYDDHRKTLEDINKCGYILNSGELFIDESKTARFILPLELLKQCDKCCWMPICLLTTCPYRGAKNLPMRCKLNGDKSIQDVENNIVAQYKKGIFIKSP